MSIEMGGRVREETVFEVGDGVVGVMFYDLFCSTEKNVENCL